MKNFTCFFSNFTYFSKKFNLKPKDYVMALMNQDDRSDQELNVRNIQKRTKEKIGILITFFYFLPKKLFFGAESKMSLCVRLETPKNQGKRR